MLLQVLVLLTLQGALAQAVTLVATVASGGVKGTVTFTQTNSGDPVSVTYALGGPTVSQASSWQFHTFRLNYDVNDRCSVNRLGPRILESVGPSAQASGTVNVTGFDLSGVNTIEGRSLVVLKADGTPLACATVESTEDYVTSHATFREGVLGNVVFRQLSSSATALTRVTSNLYSDGSETAEITAEWRVVAADGCSTVGMAYNPGSVTGTCQSTNQAGCAIGDLTGKLGNVSVGITMGSSRMTSVDQNLPLSGTNSVVGKTLQLFAQGQSTPMACVVIQDYLPRAGVVKFDNDGVSGTITFNQRSPLDPTTTYVDLSNLRSEAGGYHVHKWPVTQRVLKNQALCSGDSVSGHFNPFGVVYNASSPGPAASTDDMYEVGDLSKKYGMLNGKNDLSANYTDYNLPLFGTNSILGRSIVIHKTSGARWVCANIQDTVALISAQATFTYPVIGYALLQQRLGESGAQTSIYLELDYADGSTDITADHAWAVHVNAAGQDMMSADLSTRCASAGDVMNSLQVSATNYATQCMPSDPLRCELGDLKGKHGAVSVRGANRAPARAFFTDVNLPLQGSNSVLGKALVIKSADGGTQNLACANLLKVWPLQARAYSWGSTNYGSVTFTQQVGVIQSPTTIQFDLKHLPTDSATTYSVDTDPVAQSGNRCGSLGGVYNPFNVTSAGTTKDTMAVGDLSDKFGSLSQATVSKTEHDPTLDLWGPRGVTGRSVAMASSGSNMACAEIDTKMAQGGYLFKAKAVFTGEYTGEITLTQVAYTDGAMTPTTVVVNLRKANGNQTLRHNWHTHQRMVSGDAAATTGRCSSTGGHYNPFNANVQDGYSECGVFNPLRCELGDQSNKLGTYNMGSGPMVATDVYLPLYGPQGVIGRSIVVHAEDRGAPRIACADIMPADLTNSYLLIIAARSSLDLPDMVSTIATAINTQPYNVAVLPIDTSRTDCADIRVYFLGMQAAQHEQAFKNVVVGDSSVLGIYRPVTCKSATIAVSLLLLLTSFIVGRLLS